jgi:type IV secretory pathway TraG/TraD family ATPase VirD4
MTGVSGKDCPLGVNVHRGQGLPVALDESMRFRHTYVVGQTGTGKSTLLQNMILHDIHQGRGVAVLDPHGSLIDGILERFPERRSQDLVVVDLTDTEFPVGFNPLRLLEQDPQAYRLARDLVIDGLYTFLDRTYGLKETGGPMFENHFRSVLGLLLGTEPQREPRIPNLMMVRAFYTNEDWRTFLAAMNDDPVLETFLQEATRAGGEADMDNAAPYITSKFSRFISDTALRNITCQNRTLDIEGMANEGKVLLFHLGRGRFGDQAAGLLASQLVSRIHHAVMSRGTTGQHRPFFLYADEFQLFADQRFAELLAEARKFGLAMTLAHQYAQQLPREVLLAVLGNVGTTISFRVGAPDGELLEPLFCPEVGRRDLTSLPNFSAYVRSFGMLGETPFSLRTLPPMVEGDRMLAQRLRELSQRRYGRDRVEVETEITATYRACTSLLF